MTFKLKLSDQQPKEEVLVPTTDLFEEYVRVLGTKPDDHVYDLCTLVDGNFHTIVKELSPQHLIDELVVEYLSSDDKNLPFYYLKLHLIGTGYVLPLIPRHKYDELRVLNTPR